VNRYASSAVFSAFILAHHPKKFDCRRRLFFYLLSSAPALGLFSLAMPYKKA
jgi:hypothetical protein